MFLLCWWHFNVTCWLYLCFDLLDTLSPPFANILQTKIPLNLWNWTWLEVVPSCRLTVLLCEDGQVRAKGPVWVLEALLAAEDEPSIQHPVGRQRPQHHACWLLRCAGLLRVTLAGTGVRLLTSQGLGDVARRCRLPWKVRTPCGGNMDQYIEQPAALVEFLLCLVAGCWKQSAKLCLLEFD